MVEDLEGEDPVFAVRSSFIAAHKERLKPKASTTGRGIQKQD